MWQGMKKEGAMAMRVRSISYTVKEGFKNLWRNRMMSLASISSVMATLIILGMILILILNINSLSEGIKDQFDAIQIYLSDEIGDDRIEKVGQELKQIEGIKEITYESKTKALENMKERLGENGYLLEGLESNPLPNSYIIYLKNIENSIDVVDRIKSIEGIETVKFYKDIIDKLISITNFVKMVGLIVIVILIIISIFIIGNTIKLTVSARRKEITIMKYVGATNWFIRGPFLIEGSILGLIGSSIAIGIIYVGYKYAYELISQQLYVMVSAYFLPVELILNNLVIIFLVLGSGIGALGSIMSMRKYLRV